MTENKQTDAANPGSPASGGSAARPTDNFTTAMLTAAIASMPPPLKWTDCVANPAHVAKLTKHLSVTERSIIGGMTLWSKPRQVADCWMFSDRNILKRYLNDELTELDLFELMQTGAVQPNENVQI